MSEPTAAASPPTPGTHAAHRPSYVTIWAVLLVLLGVSVAGPAVGIRVVTLITAFGVAIVKAYLVAVYFMHVNLDRKYVTYLLLTMVALMMVFVGGVSPDVMKHEGHHWSNAAAERVVEKGMREGVAEGEHEHAP